MNRESYQRVREIFHAACEFEPEARARYLDETCANQPEIRRDVESLFTLERRGMAGELDTPAVGVSVLRELASTQAGNSPPDTAAEPCVIGRYKLLELIGEGGFGTVFMAEQTEPVVRRVALKIIKAGMDTKQVIARFEAERQALALMDHPNIARVLDAGATDSGRPYFVMELVHGEPATAYCDCERLPLRQRLHLFRDICGAVQHAHQKGIIHRDLKPSNILVANSDQEGLGTEDSGLSKDRTAKPSHSVLSTQRSVLSSAQPKIIDFGIAKATAGRLTDKTLFTELHQLIGTPQYMSPEQAEVSGEHIDTRSDIYALGVLLYELLAGATPFDGRRLRSASLAEIQRIIREEEPPRPSLRLSSLVTGGTKGSRGHGGQGEDVASGPQSLAPSSRSLDPSAPRALATDIARRRGTDPTTLARRLRGDLDWIVMKCLEKDRDRRYATASALADDVERYLLHQPVLATPPSARYRLRKFVRRNRVSVVAGVVVAGTLLIATGVSVSFGLSAQRSEAESKARANELEQVAKFQEEQFSGIDAQTMGTRLRAGLLAKVREATGRSLSPDEVDARVDELETLIAGSDFTGLALGALDDNFFHPALGAIEEQFADQPLVKARLLQTLATTLHEVGLIDAAGAPQEEALAIRRNMLGDEHPDTLRSVNNMGGLLQAQGKLDHAEPHYREALEKLRRVLGDEHPDTLRSINNMGYFLRARGKLDQAEPYYREALEKRRQVLGDEHPDTLRSISNMAALLDAQSKPDQAEPYYREALEKRRQVLGDEHPDTLVSIGNMGILLQGQGKLDEAEPYFREALEKQRRVLGDEHPHTLIFIGNLGALLQAQGKLDQAEPYYREALEKKRRVLGDEHPETLLSINNMGILLRTQGKLDQAEPYFREALEKYRRVLGDEHRHTLISINNLGALLQAQDKLDEAEPLHREALEKRRRMLGDEHPDTLISIGNMGMLLQAQGKAAEAIALLAPAEPAARREFTGSNAVRLGRFLTSLGWARVATGEFDAAEANLSEAQAILSMAKGAAERDRADVLGGLVKLYEAWHTGEPDGGHDDEAAEWRAKLAEWQASTQSTPP